MYFDYLTVALIAFGMGGMILGAIDDSDTPEEVTPDPDPTTDPGGGESGEETDYISEPTDIYVTTDGETKTTTFDDIDYGVIPTVVGTDAADTIVADDGTGFEVILTGGAGDDDISFGYGASVDGGNSDDTLALSVTQNALASNNGSGTIDMTQSDDSLEVTFEEDTPEFVHTVRGQSSETVDGEIMHTEWIDYYVSGSATLDGAALGDDNLYDAEAATRVFRAVIFEGPEADAALMNTEPEIILNRTIASARDVTVG